MNLDETLHLLAVDPSADVDLAELALRLAADEYPDLDVPLYLARIDELGHEVAARVELGESLPEKVAELAGFLFEEQGFEGNADNYYDPRNSYLSDVLDRKLGLPITLSVLAMAVGSRCGLTVGGIGLPGHFVAIATSPGEPDVVFDPFHAGQFLDEDGCAAVVTAVTGQPFAITPETLTPTPTGLIALRMLNNLKAVYLRAQDFRRAARVIGRIVQLSPADPTQRRDLGVSLSHAGKPGAAIDHLTAYLAALPMADDAKTVRDFLMDARRQVAKWN